MAYAKTSLRAEQRALREKMRKLGMSHQEIAVEFARRYRLRPRAAWRNAYGWSLTEAAERISTYASRAGLGSGATVAMTAAHLSEHENWPGHGAEPAGRRPTPYLLSLLAAVYGCSVHDLLDVADYKHMPPADRLVLDKASGGAGAEQPDARSLPPGTPGGNDLRPGRMRRLTDGDRPGGHLDDIRSLAEWIASTNTTDDVIEQAERSAAYLAQVHGQMPPRMVLAGVLQSHRGVRDCLQGGRQRLRQTRELLRVDSALLAHAGLLLGDLGRDAEAAEYGKTSLLLAQEAGVSEATARAVQAKTARWQGKYVQSAELARRGFEASELSQVKAELAYREANAIALFGDASRARRTLRRAQDVAEALPSENRHRESVWSFPAGRQAVFALSVAIHTADPDGALRAAAMAEAAWAQGEPKVPANWAQIQTGASIAYLMKDSLDAAAHHMAAVLDLPADLRISTVTGYLRKLDGLLAQARYSGNDTASELRHQISDFISCSAEATDAAESQ